MPEAIVDRLEMIRVNDEQRARARSTNASDFKEAIDGARERSAIEATGQAVGRCQMVQTMIGNSQFAQLESEVEKTADRQE